MRIPNGLDWNLTPKEAAEQQRQLASRVVERNELGPVKLVAGVDVGFEEDMTVSRAAAVVLTFPQLEPVEAMIARRKVTFPYIPGLLAYRELPSVLDALARLRSDPDLIIVDGHGRSHPRRFGITCYLGVLLDCVTIGCAKSVLIGKAEEPLNRVGAWTPLVDKGEIIGAALRTKVNVKPIYVSIGNKIDLETAIELVGKCTTKYRLPETSRYAHNIASAKGELSSSPL